MPDERVRVEVGGKREELKAKQGQVALDQVEIMVQELDLAEDRIRKLIFVTVEEALELW